MGRKYKLALFAVIPVAVIALVLILARGHDFAVLSPAGEIGQQERDLMITATLLMLLVVIPVFILMFYIVWRYREENKSARYQPNWDGHRGLEFLWWALPFAIIFTLSIVTVDSSHQLDPSRPIAGPNPLNIQVVALQWKWLFIYPDAKVASVNYMEMPVDRPVTFSITSDAPMNSFWIPQLGGQVYAMSGMDMKLNLIADKPGSYRGLSANISGRGFADMQFTDKAVSSTEYDRWISQLQKNPDQLTSANYETLLQPATSGVRYYSQPAPNLYDRIVLKYMVPESQISVNSTLSAYHEGHY